LHDLLRVGGRREERARREDGEEKEDVTHRARRGARLALPLARSWREVQF
jgi:hypothetical protein